jgi:Tfp pilus assembly protein PilV
MKTQSKSRKQRGQGMTEYVIIVALIAVSAIGVYSLFGRTVRNQTAGLAQEVAGTNATGQINQARTNAATAATNAEQQKGLANYNQGNLHGTAAAN